MSELQTDLNETFQHQRPLNPLFFSLQGVAYEIQNGWTKDASVRKTTKVILILIAVHFLTHYQIYRL